MSPAITKITYSRQISLVTLSRLPCDSKAVARVLSAFGEVGINVDMISQTAPQGGTIRLSFSISDERMSQALRILGSLKEENLKYSSEILPGNCKLAFYDSNMVNTPNMAARVLTYLSQADISVMLITTSELDISLLIGEHDLNDALALMREHYGLEPEETTL